MQPDGFPQESHPVTWGWGIYICMVAQITFFTNYLDIITSVIPPELKSWLPYLQPGLIIPESSSFVCYKDKPKSSCMKLFYIRAQPEKQVSIQDWPQHTTYHRPQYTQNTTQVACISSLQYVLYCISIRHTIYLKSS